MSQVSVACWETCSEGPSVRPLACTGSGGLGEIKGTEVSSQWSCLHAPQGLICRISEEGQVSFPRKACIDIQSKVASGEANFSVKKNEKEKSTGVLARLSETCQIKRSLTAFWQTLSRNRHVVWNQRTELFYTFWHVVQKKQRKAKLMIF